MYSMVEIVARCAGLPICHTAWLIDTSSHNTDVILLYVVAAGIAIHFQGVNTFIRFWWFRWFRWIGSHTLYEQ